MYAYVSKHSLGVFSSRAIISKRSLGGSTERLDYVKYELQPSAELRSVDDFAAMLK